MVGPFALDGYEVLAPLDGSGRSWRAVCLDDGCRVVLRRWPGGAARVAEARRRAALWGSIAGDGAVAVRDVVVLGDDVVVVNDLATGGGLAGLIERRGRLTPGQVVTLVAPIARTLAVVHHRGLAHGRISPSNVVLEEDGRPILTDWLLAGEGEPAADVEALAAMALRYVRDDAPERLLSVLRSPVDARTLADELLSAVPAEPLLGSPISPACSSSPDDEPMAAPRGVVAAMVVVAIAIGVAVGAGVLWGRGDSSADGATLPPHSAVSVSSPPTPARTPIAPNWQQLVRSLERRRIRALASGDRRRLAASELRGTALWRHDVRVVSRLVATGARLRGVQAYVRSAHVRSVHDGRVVVQVIDVLTSYDVVSRRGAVLARHSPRAPQAVLIVLTRREGRWLIADVSRRLR